ncbi:MAG: hypothetical protein U1E82_07245 [Nitrosomonas sp.]
MMQVIIPIRCLNRLFDERKLAAIPLRYCAETQPKAEINPGVTVGTLLVMTHN